MKRTLTATALLTILAMPAVAQVQWTDFPVEQARLSFDPPDLPLRPTRAVEGVNPAATKKTHRSFGYIFNRPGGPDAYAQVYVWSIAADATYFTSVPNFDGLLPTFYLEFKNQQIAWQDANRLEAPSPMGPTEYRRFNLGTRSCLAFGGLFGHSAVAPFAGGNARSGTEQVMGYYCAKPDRSLSGADAALVLSRLSFGELGKAKGPRPASF